VPACDRRLPGPLAAALRSKGAFLFSRGHREESFGVTKHALEVALEHDLAEDASICYFLLSDRCFRRDRYAEALDYLEDRSLLRTSWGADRSSGDHRGEEVDSGGVVLGVLQSGVYVHIERGERASRRVRQCVDQA
jgi:hypothetical protein